MADEYKIDYEDKRFQTVETDKKNAITDLEKTYSGIIDKSDSYFQSQIDAAKDWEKKQTQLQNEKTDFAIQEIEQQKDQAKKDYTKEQSGAYVDWQKQSNEYGANAEAQAAQGMQNTGYSESSQVSMYNTYQNRVVAARESYNKAVLNYNNAITEARLQNNSALAEIAYNALQQQLELSLQGFQYKNQLVLEQANKKLEVEQMFHERWQDVLSQINTENALAEEVRQFNENMAWEKYVYEQAHKKSSGGGGGGGGGSGTISAATARANQSKSARLNGDSSSGGDDSSSGGASVNLKSVLSSGLGPASGTTIANAVKSGKVTATQKGNQVYISPSKSRAASKSSVTSKLLFSKSRF